MNSRPNILIVMAEHWTPLADPARQCLRQPAIDAFAREAVRFERAYCNAPVCGPSRLSFLSGLHPHRCGGYDNGSILPPHVPTFAHLLTSAGYQTAMCGRMHIHGLNPHVGFERRLSAEIIDPLPCVPTDWPAPLLPLTGLPTPTRAASGETFRDSPIHRHDEHVADRACAHLRELGHRRDPRPFCLVVGTFTAHPGIRHAPQLQPAYERYLGEDLPLPRFGLKDYEQLPEHIRRLHQIRRTTTQVFDRNFHHVQMASWFARLEYLDGLVGRVLGELDSVGLADDTVVIVTADHGENAGRHGLWGKMNFYEEAQRVPLMVRGPGMPPRAIQSPVALVDVMPTLADLAGAALDVPHDGRSLWPALTGRDDGDPHRVIFSEYHGYLSAGDMYMLLQDDLKLCRYEREPATLHDLSGDPEERHDVIESPAYASRRTALEAALAKHVDIADVGQAIAQHNRQRALVCAGHDASELLRQQVRQCNAAWRDSLAEPWWDGGEYLNA